jgi:hypothetical protein
MAPPTPEKRSPAKVFGAVAVIIIIIIAIAAVLAFYPYEEPFPSRVSEQEPNDEGSLAQELRSGQTVEGNVQRASDPDDYFKVNVEEGTYLCSNLTGPTGADLDLHAYESSATEANEVAISNYADTSEEQICLVTMKTGYYYLRVLAYDGNGDYELEISVRKRVSSVDDNDSVSEAVSISDGDSITSTVDKYWDLEDYYAIDVELGEYLIAILTVPEESDFDLYIYNTTGTGGDDWHNIDIGFNEGMSNRVYGDEFLNIAVDEDAGTWYVNVYAYRGSGSYTLKVYVESSITADDSDDEDIAKAENVTAQLVIDGYEDITGTLDHFNDRNDYYKVWLEMGYTLTMRLDVPGHMDFDLYVYDSTGTGWDDYIMVSNGTTHQEVLYLKVTKTDLYYVNPYSYSGTGQYDLELILSGDSGWPIADAGPDVPNARVNQVVNFDGSNSVDDVSIVSYDWTFGDGNSDVGMTTSHAYTQVGSYMVNLRVEDADGHQSNDTLIVNVLEAGSNKYAVVVGVSDYINNDAINDLSYADDDAYDWNDYLVSLGYDVTLLVDHDATEPNIVSAIEDMKAQEQAGDYVVFVFSGHGGSWNRARIKDYGQHVAVFAADTNLLGDGALTDTEIGDLFSDFDTDHIFIFIDACHSGGVDEPAGTGRMIIQASADDEYSWDDPKYQNGLWTYWFLEWAIQEKGFEAMEGAFNAAEAEAVPDTGGQTHPEMEDGDLGEYFYL